MKPILIYIACIVLTVVLSYFFPSVSFDENVANVLFTVTGIVFSIGLSLTVVSSTTGIKNQEIKKRIRNDIKKTRNNFIICFSLAATIYVIFIILPKEHYKFFNKDIGILICQGVAIAYFVFNFIAIQKFNEDIEDVTT